MKIIIMTDFGSSGYFQPPYPEYMGGQDGIREHLEGYDVVVAIWPPEDRPIVLKAPDDVVIEGAVWRRDPDGVREPMKVPSVTAERMHEIIISGTQR